jgi:hypothetical protein
MKIADTTEAHRHPVSGSQCGSMKRIVQPLSRFVALHTVEEWGIGNRSCCRARCAQRLECNSKLRGAACRPADAVASGVQCRSGELSLYKEGVARWA